MLGRMLNGVFDSAPVMDQQGLAMRSELPL